MLPAMQVEPLEGKPLRWIAEKVQQRTNQLQYRCNANSRAGHSRLRDSAKQEEKKWKFLSIKLWQLSRNEGGKEAVPSQTKEQ
jgi:hypothetical protein